MDKIKFFAFIAVTAVFFACGSQDEGSPPKLKNGGRAGYISPFDTLVAEFDSKIVGVNNLEGKISSIQDMIQVSPDNQTANKKLYFVGTHDTTLGGKPYFKPGILEGSIRFLKLENEDGYIRAEDILYFSTYNILDKEPNGDELTAGDIDSMGTVTDSVIFAGVLDHYTGSTPQGEIYDMQDYYKLKLRAADNVTIKVRNIRDHLNLTIKGPSGVRDTTFTTAKKDINVFTYKVGTDHLLADTTLNAASMVPFYIKVSDNSMNTPPNPYTIYVKRN